MRYLLSSCLFIVAVFFGSCSSVQEPSAASDTPKAQPQMEEDAYYVGIITALSGPAITYGTDNVRVYQTIVDEINAQGGINGIPVHLVIEDGACNSQQGAKAMNRLLEKGVQVVIGGSCSSSTISAGKIAQENGVVLIAPTSSSPEISDIGAHVFRSWNDLRATQKLNEYLEKNEAETIAFIYESDDSYSSAYVNALKKIYEGEVLFSSSVSKAGRDFDGIAKKIRANANVVDNIIVILNNSSDNIALIEALASDGSLRSVRNKLIGSEVFLTDQVLSNVGSNSENLKTISLVDLSSLPEKSLQFVRTFKKKNAVLSSEVFIVLHAETTVLVLDAIREVGYDATKIQEYISGFNKNNPRDGLYGEYFFDGFGDGQGIDFTIKQVRKGQLVSLEQ